jgi:hypothetical protein
MSSSSAAGDRLGIVEPSDRDAARIGLEAGEPVQSGGQ